MAHRTVPPKLAPAGLVVDRHKIGAVGIVVHMHGASPTSTCPACGLASSAVHSRYGRTLGDLAAHGRRLRICLAARRFRRQNAACKRSVFTEPFAPDLIQARTRRMAQLDVLVHATALTLPNLAVPDGIRLFYLPPFFAGACALGSTYGFLQGAWPFGLVEAVWAVVALARWRRRVPA